VLQVTSRPLPWRPVLENTKTHPTCAYPYFVVSSEVKPFGSTPSSSLYRDLTNSSVPKSDSQMHQQPDSSLYHIQCTSLSRARVLPLAERLNVNHKREQPLALCHSCSWDTAPNPASYPFCAQTPHKRHHVVCLACPVSNRLCERDWFSPIYVN
jgi:hypothetical protein